MTDSRIRENYEFDNFCILTAERVLLRDGKPQALPPKVFDILLVLVEHSGHLVEKAELMDQVWPETHVEENNLTVNMSALRKALGEDRKYIETVPRRGYRFVAGVRKVTDEKTEPEEKWTTETGGERGVLRDEIINSLAVLPFANMSDNPNLEYLSDGITESIINSLSQLPRLKTMARSTVFRYKDQKIAPLEAGRDMRVRSVLVGRVLQSGDSLNISTELVDVIDGSQIWSEQYNRQFLNILAAQEEISREVSEQLRLKLTTEERRRFAKRYTENTEAYHLYLKGRYFWSKYTKEGVVRSIEYYQQAIDTDPVYALAYAGLAEAYYALSTTHLPPREAMPKARAAAMKALEIDATLSEAHSTLGMIGMLYDWDWVEAERAYQRAIEFGPGNAMAHQRYGMYLDMMGRFDEGMAEMKLAQELDPLSLPTNVNIGVTFYLMGQYDRAIAQYKSALEMDSSFTLAHHHLAQVYTMQGRFPEALEEFQNAKLLEESAFALGHLGRIYAMMGNRSEALKILDRLNELSKQSYVSPYRMTMIYAALDEMDRAFEWLEKAYLDRSEELAWLNIFPVPGKFRSDPRFTDMLRRIGFATR
jgi:DNA-binding winged helix-turn-helix (wHTH) protein/tetratricopeptide (TPR) repeat protein